MVSSEDLILDEVILQVFEEQDRAFHFPVTSQNDARAFVRALNKKGLSNDCLSQEIKEPEQNFSAWRTGISRPRVGNRVIERINRPLQEILLSDGDDDSVCCDKLSTCSGDTTESGETDHNGNDSLHRTEEQPVAELKSTDNRKIAQSLSGSAGYTTDNSQIILEKDINDSQGSNDKVMVEQGQDDSKEIIIDNRQVSEISDAVANRIDDSEVQKSAYVVCESIQNTVGNGNPLTEMCDTKNKDDLKLVETDETDRENTAEETMNSENEKIKDHVKFETLHDIAETECQLTHAIDDSFINAYDDEKATSLDKNMSENSLKQENISSVEVGPSCTVNTADVELLGKQMTDREFVRHAVNYDKHLNYNVIHEKVEDVKESCNVSSESGSEVPVINDTKVGNLEYLDRAQVNDSTGPTIQSEAADPTAAAMNSAFCDHSVETATVNSYESSGDVFENYDSDHEFTTDDTARVTEKENEMDKKESLGHDAGYIYMFTDSSSDDEEFRVKVGASRFPHKKLKQALLFNVDLRLVSAVKVCHRQKAFAAVQQQLSKFAIPNTTGWFCGPMDKILKVLMDATEGHSVQN